MTLRIGRRRAGAVLLTVASLVGLLTIVAATPATADPALGSIAPHVLGPHVFAADPGDADDADPTSTQPVFNLDQGAVQDDPQVYVVFWDWTSDPSGEKPYLINFLSSVGPTDWMATVNQYNGGDPTLAGTWDDPTPIPAVPTDAQIQQEAVNADNHFGAGADVNVQIVVATPTGHSTANFPSACAYHAPINALPDASYTNLPYTTDGGATCGEDSVNKSTGTLDGVSIVEGHELAETITDPLFSGWYSGSLDEIADKCAWTGLNNITTSAGTFAVQPLWSNAANGCVLETVPLSLPDYQATFQANTGKLYTVLPGSDANRNLGLLAGTSPSTASAPDGSWQVAFQANTGVLWTLGAAGHTNWGYGMKAGTSPSVASIDGGFQVAFQASTGNLWTVGADGIFDWGYGMKAGTSPSIATVANGFEVAFQANTGDLWTIGDLGNTNWGLGMMAGTSPSITALNGGFEVAFQANTGNLYTVGSATAKKNWGLAMKAGTSPSITSLKSSYQVAFQANTGNLNTVGSTTAKKDWGLGMKAGTSPSITTDFLSDTQIAFQANTGDLYTVGSATAKKDWGLDMKAGTSPSIASAAQ